MRLKWKPGPQSVCAGSYFVSATRFTYLSYMSMPLVFWHGLRLRRTWPAVDGAVGLSIKSDLKTKTTYTLSVWRRAEDLHRWVRSPRHARLMSMYGSRLNSSAVASWSSPAVDLRALWREAMNRVGLSEQLAKMTSH
jgi:hypothetical protein